VAADPDGAETNTVSVRVINPSADAEIWINEIHYDNDGVDVDEGVEIAGTAGVVLSDYSLILYNGLNGNVYSSNALTGTLDDEQCGYGAAWFGFSQLQNDTEGIALVKGTEVVQFLSYEGVLTASNGPALGMTSVDIGVRESAVHAGILPPIDRHRHHILGLHLEQRPAALARHPECRAGNRMPRPRRPRHPENRLPGP
jgi:hypothetical protein